MGGELNYRQQVLDEICLEGLSGITLQVKSPVETFWGAFITKDTTLIERQDLPRGSEGRSLSIPCSYTTSVA